MKREGGIPPEKEKEIREKSEAQRKQFNKLFSGLEAAGKELQREAIRDSLTGLLTRRAFEEEAGKFAAQLQRGGLSHLTVAIFDLDFFKQINDRYGHAAGDAALRTFAVRLREAVREADIVARWGGEEFAVAFPLADTATILKRFGADPEKGVPARFRVPAKVKDEGGAPRGVELTVSGGITELRHDEKLEDALARADRALYFSKEHGRNQIVSDADLSEKEK